MQAGRLHHKKGSVQADRIALCDRGGWRGPLGDGIAPALGGVVGDEQFGQEADRHQLAAQQQQGEGIDTAGFSCRFTGSSP